ncbi:MAG: CDP-2,3-bis-(O-geranylgeranyl)-sn-glycerol synthase [Candidatus Methanoperedens sp.]|nr:CDP-2,3-bis-(O-geranylgeranyl)-sn-glycerol synthase [Candidatus Methanoperedens sp.]MCZ7406524.1 CDP-2,3-bis-(O-geranylgeranyl)-sn-glycerol synthase [Candidatus Methanoperedens sp.]
MFETIAGIIAVVTGYILKASWLMLPAYIANPTAVVFGGGTPIDFGKNWKDGRRILGDGKTFRGLIGGTVCGIIVGLIQMQAPSQFSWGAFTLAAIVALSFGALLGDIVKSFFKRRLGLARGAEFPLVDQLDFVAGAWILSYIVEPKWFIENFTFGIIITVIIFTPILHRLTNIIGYYAKLKKEPW